MTAGSAELAALGKELRRRRQVLGLTIEELAKRAKITARALTMIENGERDPSAMVLVALAHELGVAVGTLLGEGPAESEEAPSIQLVDDDDDSDLEETASIGDSLQPGMFIGRKRYAIIERIGVGGQAIVYKAEDTLLRRCVAVKFLLDEYAPLPETRDRFLREAQALASIDHPNIVQLLDIDQQPNGSYFVVQQLLEGETLRERMDAEPRLLPREAIDSIVIPLMGALVTAHGKGIIHRDVKPENIILARTPSNDRIPKLIDFGIAKLVGPTRQRLTQFGIAMGTPGYMSPEQILDASTAGAPADVWAIGMLLFEIFTGKMPFEGTAGTLIDSTKTRAVPRADTISSDVPAEIAQLVADALIFDPERRPSMRSMRSRLIALRMRADLGLAPAGSTLTALALPTEGPTEDDASMAARAQKLRDRARKMRISVPNIEEIEEVSAILEEDPTVPFGAKERRAVAAFSTASATHFDPGSDSDGIGAIPISKDPRMNRLVGEAIRGLGMNALTNALAYVDRALLIGSPEDPSLGIVKLIAAITHHWLGNCAEAERFALQASQDLPKGSPGWATALGYLATAYSDRGNAKDLHSIIRDLRAAAPASLSSAWTIATSRLVQALARTGFVLPAQQLLATARKRAAEKGLAEGALTRAWLSVGQAAIDIHRGDIMRHLGSVSLAIDAFGEARDVRNACVQRVNAGNAYMHLGGHREAESELRAVLRVAEPMHLRFVPALRVNLGFALARLNRLDEALAMETEAIELCKKQGNKRFECVGRIYLANILLRREDAPAAVRAAEEAIQCAKDFPGLDAYAHAMLGSVYLRKSKPPRAMLAARGAMDLLTKLHNIEEGEALIRVVDAEAHYANNQKAEAMKLIKAAHDRIVSIADEIDDPHWRKSFLENVPENARTMRFAKEWELGEAEDDTAIEVRSDPLSSSERVRR